MLIWRALAQTETQLALTTIWTQITDFNPYEDDREVLIDYK